MVKFTFGLESCGTVQEDDGEKIYYKNKVYLMADPEQADNSSITRENWAVIPFQCGYDKKATVSKVSYNPRQTQIITDAGNVSILSLDLVVCLATKIRIFFGFLELHGIFRTSQDL